MSDLEAQLAWQLRVAKVAEPTPQYRFAPPRKWTFDFAWPSTKLAVECEGGIWMQGGGRHTRGAGYERDCDKYNAAVMHGWRVLRFTASAIKDGRALTLIERALKGSNA